jgi:hypothetical protein
VTEESETVGTFGIHKRMRKQNKTWVINIKKINRLVDPATSEACVLYWACNLKKF